jgi:autotransporter adhesin
VAGDSGRSVARRWEVGAAWFGAALAAAGIVAAVTAALPPVLENLASKVADGVTAVSIGDDAEVVVPADWIVSTHAGDAVAVRTPDGVLRAQLEAVDEDATAIISETPGVEGAPRSEQLASGMSAVHAGLEDGGYVAVVGGPHGANVRVVIEVRGGDFAAYRPAIAHLLEGIRA